MDWKRIAASLARPPLWCTLVLCAVFLAARRPEMLQNPQFWAEDGPVFFLQSRTHGAESLLLPSAGYLHTVLRVIAWLTTWFDPMFAPACYVAAAGLLTLYVAARTQSLRFPLPPSFGYALAVVLVPDASEILLTLTNLQWVLAAGLILVLIAREPERTRQRVHDVIAVTALGLTGPFVVALLPLFLWRAWSRRTGFSVVLAVLATAAAGVQAWLIFRQAQPVADAPIAWETLLAIPGVRIGGALLSGGHWNVGVGLAWATLLGVITISGVIALARSRGPAKLERTWLALAFGGLLAISLFRCRHVLPALLHGAGSRYFFPLQIIALWLVIAVAAGEPRRMARVAGCVLVGMAALNLPRLREPAFTDFSWPEYAARIRAGESVVVPINPDWEFTMPTGNNPRPITNRRGAPNASLINISARCIVTAEKPAIAGLTLRPGSPREFLVRAVGPSLSRFGVKDTLARPKITLLNGSVDAPGFHAVRNGVADPLLAEATKRCRAFPLEAGAADMAGVVMLGPGVYSVIVSAEPGERGEVLLEVYEVPCDKESGEAPG